MLQVNFSKLEMTANSKNAYSVCILFTPHMKMVWCHYLPWF